MISSVLLDINLGGPPVPIVHTSSYVSSIGNILDSLSSSREPFKIAVIGSGQSSAEALLDIYKRLELLPSPEGRGQHEVHMILRRGSLKPSDDSPFVNEIFDPECESTETMHLRAFSALPRINLS